MMTNIINTLKKTIAMAMGTICGLTSLCVSGINTDTYAVSDDNMALYEEMLSEVNEYRSEYGVSPLKLDYNLCEAAEIRSEEITQLFSHTRPDGRGSSSIFEDYGITKQYSGENIAYHYRKSVPLIMDAWMNSDGHRANILSPDYQYLSVGLYEKDGYYYWTQIFYSTGEMNSVYEGSSDAKDTLEIMYGDVNGDGVVNASDASEVLSIYAQMSSGVKVELSSEEFECADVNGDDVINSSDASGILNYYAMLSTGREPSFE